MNSSEIGSETSSSNIEPNDQDWANAVDKHVEKAVKNYFNDEYELSKTDINIQYNWEKPPGYRIANIKMNGQHIGNLHYTSDTCYSSTSAERFVKFFMIMEEDINKFLTRMKL